MFISKLRSWSSANRTLRLITIIGLLAFWVCVLWLAQAALAAGAAPASGGAVLTVNSSGDSSNVGDGVLSLRKAISVANGTLNGPFSVGERNQMQGCVFDAFGNITNACGGSNVLIQFTPTLTHVVLTDRPPYMYGPGTTINGSVASGRLIIDGSGGADNGFITVADDITLANLAIINIGGPAADIQTYVSTPHKGLRVFNTYLNVLPDTSSCSDPRLTAKANFPVIVWVGSGTAGPGAGTAYFYNNVVGCGVNDGIEVSGPYVYIGQDAAGNPGRNWIGVNASGQPLPNGQSGVNLSLSGATNAVVANNMIAYNTTWGVFVDQTQNETLSGNDIHHNQTTGVYVSSTTGTLLTNNLVHDNNDSGVWLSGGTTYSTTISGGAYYSNGAFGIVEGEGAFGNTWRQISTYNNFGLGIDKNDNGLPDATGSISITAATRVGGVVSVTGEYLGGPNFRYHEIDLYRAAPDSSGFGEGRTYLGSTSFSDNFSVPVPVWSIVDPTGCGGTYTVVITDYELFNVPPPQSFEFSANFNSAPGCQLYLPLVRR
jgi:parallel beta-helix repeat protein